MIKPTLVISPAGTNNFTRGLLTNLLPNGDLKFERSTDGRYIDRDGLIKSEIADSPRFHYGHGSNRPPSILLEPARGQRFEYTEEFSRPIWEKVTGGSGLVPVVTINQGVAPDGNLTADRVQFSTGGGTTSGDYSVLAQGVDNVFNGNQELRASMSFYVKSFDGEEYDMVFYTRNSLTNFEFKVTSEWTRVDLPTYQTALTNVRHGIGIRGDLSSSNPDILLWGAQWELGVDPTFNGNDVYPTTYIYNTEPAGELRDADSRQTSFDPGTLGALNPDEGAITIRFNTKKLARDNNGPWFRIGGLSNTGRFYIYNSSSSAAYPYVLALSGGGHVNTTTKSEFSTVTFTWADAGTAKLYVDGVLIGETPSGFNMDSTTIELGGADQPWEVFSIIFHDVRPTDDEVAEIVGYDTYAELANNYLYNID